MREGGDEHEVLPEKTEQQQNLLANQRAFQPIDPFVHAFEFSPDVVLQVIKTVVDQSFKVNESLIKCGPHVVNPPIQIVHPLVQIVDPLVQIGHAAVLIKQTQYDSEANQQGRSPLAQNVVGYLHLDTCLDYHTNILIRISLSTAQLTPIRLTAIQLYLRMNTECRSV
jgi:hypothetical protein